MRKFTSGLLITTALMMLTGCTSPQPSGDVVTYYPRPVDEFGVSYKQTEISLFDTGRAISDNAVDIYDPASTSIKLPNEQALAESPLATFPQHPVMLIKDEDVVVFSLATSDTEQTIEYPDPLDGLTSMPVPLVIDESQLPP